MTPMTPERIAELRALADAATPGPWRVRWFPVDTVTGEGGDYVVEAGDINGHAEELICYGDWDGDFIATARTAVPELLAEVERLKSALDDIADLARTWVDRTQRDELGGDRGEEAWRHALALAEQAKAEQRTNEVWSDEVAPGGFVCAECGMPVESEPCPKHGEAI